MTDDQELRLQCLEIASHGSPHREVPAEDILDMAKRIYAWVKASPKEETRQ